MRRLIGVLVAAAWLGVGCIPKVPAIAYGDPCTVPGVHSVLIPPGGVSCPVVNAQFQLAAKLLGPLYPSAALPTTDVYYLDRDILVLLDGKRVLGLYDPQYAHILVMRDGAALAHELLHLYAGSVQHVSANDNAAHLNWDANKWYALDSQFEQQVGQLTAVQQ